MVVKAGLKGFIPDVEGPVQSHYNQLHRHVAVSAFGFLFRSHALYTFEINEDYASNVSFLNDVYDNFKERRDPGSLDKSITNSVMYKAPTKSRFKAARRLELRKPVQRMVAIKEAHSDDEHVGKTRYVRDKPGRNPTVTRFFLQELDPEAERYRRVQKPLTRKLNRKRGPPLRAASELSEVLSADVPIDYFTPAYYNSLSLRERARYARGGVAFPLAKYAFAPEHAEWKTMDRKPFMKKYGKEVLRQYNIPTAEEIAGLSDSDEDDEDDGSEPDIIDLVDTSEDEDEMEVEEELDP
ncbi:hypothetical protein R3P38DRAFT_2818270 [Favolaschia claudopus]|uniref:Uncharacterized protein n=1 Tax=Favolaschia claudopus TaxID=2862362 RepID=A0AAW0EFV9_9AGAR